MRQYKYGWGRCPRCSRVMAATRFGKAFPHGHSKARPKDHCPGSGQYMGRVNDDFRKPRML